MGYNFYLVAVSKVIHIICFKVECCGLSGCRVCIREIYMLKQRMRIKKQKYQTRTLFFKFSGRKYPCRFATALLTIIFCSILWSPSVAQTIQLVSNPDAGSTDASGNSSVIYNGNLYIKYQNAAGRVQLAMLNGNALTLIPNPDAGSGINIFDNQATNPFVIYNGNLYFQYEDIAGRFRLAKYNGVSVTLVLNPVGVPGDVGGGGDPNFVLYNGNLYFQYYKLAGGGKYQLAQYNGATITLIPNPDGAAGVSTGYQANPILYNNNLYFQYQDASGTGRLAQYDGVSVTLVANPDVASGGVQGFDASGVNTPVIYNNNLYVNYLNASGIYQLGKFDGTTLSLVPNPDASTGGTYFDQTPIVYNNKLYFQYINVAGNFQIVQYDGTTMTFLSYPPRGAFFSVTSPVPWSIFNNDLFVQYYNGVAYLQLAQYNGVSTNLVADAAGAIQYFGSPIIYNSQLYTNFQNNASNFQLSQYDGAVSNLIPNVSAADPGYAGFPILFGTKMYFMYQNSSFVYQLAYISDCPTIAITATDSSICPGTNVTFNVSAIEGGNNPAYQWTVNSIVVQTGTSYSTDSLKNNDTVVCTLTNKPSACSVVAPADTIIMTVHPVPVITISGDTCQNSVLTATTSNPTDTLTWLRNGVAVLKQAISAGATYTASVTGDYSATVVSLFGCSSSSNTITVKAPLVPSVTIAPNTNNVCKGVNITFTATPTNGGAAPSYQWKINGVNAGPNSNVFSSTAFNDKDTVSCWMSSSIACVTSPTVISDSVILNITDSPAVALSVAADTNNICFGTPVTFSATPVNGGIAPSYQWVLNGSNVGSNNALYTNDTLSNGNTINCILTSSSACTIPVTSGNTIAMIVYPLPVVTDLPDTTIPVGASATLNLPVTGNIATYLWSPSNTLNNSGIANPVASPVVNTTYSLRVTTVDGCKATGQRAVNLFSGLYMPNAFTPNGDNLNDVFRISPAIKIKVNFFSIFDRWGNMVFSTNDPSIGWDGTYGGQPTAVATYVWIIQYTDPLTNLPAQSTGTVVLIR
jgi:gliding motility-associated-like protein